MSAWFKRSYVVNAPVGRRLILSSGERMEFVAVRADLGVWPPEGKECSERVAGLLREAIAARVGGVTEIGAAEHQALLDEKKNNPAGLRGRWREELSLHVSAAAAKSGSGHGPTQTFPPLDAAGAGRAAGESVAATGPTPGAVMPRPTATKVKA